MEDLIFLPVSLFVFHLVEIDICYGTAQISRRYHHFRTHNWTLQTDKKVSRCHFGPTFATLLRTAERGHTKDLRKSMCSDVKKERVQHMSIVSVHGIIWNHKMIFLVENVEVTIFDVKSHRPRTAELQRFTGTSKHLEVRGAAVREGRPDSSRRKCKFCEPCPWIQRIYPLSPAL